MTQKELNQIVNAVIGRLGETTKNVTDTSDVPSRASMLGSDRVLAVSGPEVVGLTKAAITRASQEAVAAHNFDRFPNNSSGEHAIEVWARDIAADVDINTDAIGDNTAAIAQNAAAITTLKQRVDNFSPLDRECVYLGIPSFDLTEQTVTFPSRSSSNPSSPSVYLCGTSTSYATYNQVINFPSGYSTFYIVFDTSLAWTAIENEHRVVHTGGFKAIAQKKFNYTALGSTGYLFGLVRFYQTDIDKERGVFRINSLRYKIGDTIYTNNVEEGLLSRINSVSASVSSVSDDVSELQTVVADSATKAEVAAVSSAVTAVNQRLEGYPNGTIEEEIASLELEIDTVAASQHQAFLSGGTVTFDSLTDPSKVTITVTGNIYINGERNARLTGTNTIEYSHHALQYLVLRVGAQPTLIARPYHQMAALLPSDYLFGIVRLAPGYNPDHGDGVLMLNCASYTINGVSYLNRYPTSIGTSVTSLEGRVTTLEASSFVNRYEPYPRAQYGEKLRILCIGNSFTQDTIQYIGELIRDNLPASQQANLCVARLLKGSGSIEDWNNLIGDNIVPQGGGNNYWSAVSHKGSAISDISWYTEGTEGTQTYISQPWDVIMIQQVSTEASDYSNYDELRGLILNLRGLCTNKNVRIVWNMPWATRANNTYQDLVNVSRLCSIEHGIDIIVPSGTVVENVKHNLTPSGQDPYDYWFNDGRHLRKGTAARYATSCGFWDTLIAPWCGFTLMGITTTIRGTDEPRVDQFRLSLERCALHAVHTMGGVTTVQMTS